jgi:hypothetical protein
MPVLLVDFRIGAFALRIWLKRVETPRDESVAAFAKIRNDFRGDGAMDCCANAGWVLDGRHMHGLRKNVRHDLQQEGIALREPARQHDAVNGDTRLAELIDNRTRAKTEAVHERAINVDCVGRKVQACKHSS